MILEQWVLNPNWWIDQGKRPDLTISKKKRQNYLKKIDSWRQWQEYLINEVKHSNKSVKEDISNDIDNTMSSIKKHGGSIVISI